MFAMGMREGSNVPSIAESGQLVSAFRQGKLLG